MPIPVFKYRQNSQEYISFIVTFEKLSTLSKVLVYQEDEDGYQRKPNQAHINGIKKFVLGDLNGFKLPTSIILGVDQEVVDSFLVKSKDDTLYLNIDGINDKIFRIVDGQHRIKGLEKACQELEGTQKEIINKYEFNVVCVLTKENSRSVELDIFTDINSKGKKVSTDLAELARYNYQIKEKTVTRELPNIAEHIAIKCARELREGSGNSVWHYAIKFDIHSQVNLGIIGVSAFRKSINGIILKHLSKINHGLMNLQGKELIEACDKKAMTIKRFIARCWDEAVYKKWSGCFEHNKVEDDFGEIVSIQFSKKHYIQKPLGAKSINKIIEESVDSTADLNSAFNDFNRVITSSNVKIENWATGSTFSGLNSEGGFKKIREMIKNERVIPQL